MGESQPLDFGAFTAFDGGGARGEIRVMRAAAGTDRHLGMPLMVWRAWWRLGVTLVVGGGVFVLLEGPRGRVVVGAVMVVLLAGWVLAGVWQRAVARAKALGRARLARFAASNGFSYDPRLRPFPDELAPGMVYRGLGTDHTVADVLSGVRGLPFTAFGYRFVTTVGVQPSGRTKAAHFRGVLRFELPAPLPELWLDSDTGGMVGGAWNALGRYPQKLDLEGEFRDEFTVRYRHKGAQIELLYVLQPDVMALLLDHGRGVQMQIVDRTVYLIGRFDLAAGRQATVERVFALFDALAPKLTRTALQREAARQGREG